MATAIVEGIDLLSLKVIERALEVNVNRELSDKNVRLEFDAFALEYIVSEKNYQLELTVKLDMDNQKRIYLNGVKVDKKVIGFMAKAETEAFDREQRDRDNWFGRAIQQVNRALAD